MWLDSYLNLVIALLGVNLSSTHDVTYLSCFVSVVKYPWCDANLINAYNYLNLQCELCLYFLLFHVVLEILRGA